MTAPTQDPEPAPPRWAARLRDAAECLSGAVDPNRRSRLLDEAWSILFVALDGAFAAQARRLGRVESQDLEDLVSEKALDLARRLESGAWSLQGRHDGEIVAFLRTVARNGLVDHLRTRGRLVSPEEVDIEAMPDPGGHGERTADAVHRREFAGALVACTQRLSARDRTVWFFRVFYDLPTREIAVHPEVELKPAHVDVILQRCRGSVRACMQHKGWQAEDMPPGTFATLWAAFRLPVASEEVR